MNSIKTGIFSLVILVSASAVAMDPVAVKKLSDRSVERVLGPIMTVEGYKARYVKEDGHLTADAPQSAIAVYGDARGTQFVFRQGNDGNYFIPVEKGSPYGKEIIVREPVRDNKRAVAGFAAGRLDPRVIQGLGFRLDPFAAKIFDLANNKLVQRIMRVFNFAYTPAKTMQPLAIENGTQASQSTFKAYYAVPVVAALGYAAYRKRGAIAKAMTSVWATPVLFDGVMAKAVRTRAEMAKGNLPLFLTSQIMFDEKLQKALVRLDAAQCNALEQAAINFDVSFATRKEARNAAIEQAFRDLSAVVAACNASLKRA